MTEGGELRVKLQKQEGRACWHRLRVSGPKTFWITAPDPLAAILRNIKGRNRREMIRDYHAARKLDQLSNELLRDSLSDEARASLGKIHPAFMGKEYRPNYRRQEVEIARIALASTTSDVISL